MSRHLCPGPVTPRLTLVPASNFRGTTPLPSGQILLFFSAHRYCFRVGKIPFGCSGAGGAGGRRTQRKQHVFPPVNAFFRYSFSLFLKTKRLLCINSQFVILSSNTGCKGENEGQEEGLGRSWWYWGGGEFTPIKQEEQPPSAREGVGSWEAWPALPPRLSTWKAAFGARKGPQKHTSETGRQGSEVGKVQLVACLPTAHKLRMACACLKCCFKKCDRDHVSHKA